MKKDELEALVKEQHEQIQELQQALVASAGRSMGGWVREVEERLGADYQRLAGELKRTQAELATMTARARTAESEQERDLAAQKKLADDHRKLKNEHKSCPTNGQLEKAERERTRLKTQNEKLDLAAQKLRDAEQAWKTERAQLLLDKKNLDKAFAEEKDRCASLMLEKAMIEAKHAQLEKDRANIEAQCAQLSEDKKNLEQECARLKEEKALLSSNGSLALQNAEARASQLTETNAALTRTNAAIAEEKRLAEAAAEMLRTELARLRASHNQNCTDMRELADDLREMAAKDASWAAKTAGMQTRIGELEAEREEAVRARERLENRLDAQKDELARAKERLDALRSVEKELRDCEEELASARARLDALAPVEGRLQEALNQNASLAAQGQQLEQARHELEQTRRALAALQTKNASLALYGLQESQLRARQEQNAAQQDPLHVQNLQNQLTYYMRISADARLSSTALATRVHGLEQTQAQYEERVQQYAAALNERSARVGVLEGQVAQVESQLQQTQAQHAQTQAQHAQTQTQLQQTHAQLQQTQAHLASTRSQLADTQGQLGQAQVVRSQDSQTNPVLVLRLSRKELEEREAAKDGLVRAQIEDDKALVRVAQTDLDANKIAELTAERDELLDRLKGLDVVQTSMQEQLDAANRTTSVLRGEIARLNEIRYTTSAARSNEMNAPKAALGPSNAATAESDARPSKARIVHELLWTEVCEPARFTRKQPATSTSPGSKENASPQTDQPPSAVSSEAVFGRVVLQCLRSLPWPAQGHMWTNMMMVLAPDSRVSLKALRDAFVQHSGTAVGEREFGEMLQSLSAATLPGMVSFAGDVVTGLAMRSSVGAAGGQMLPTALPATPRGPPAVLATPRSALPTPATAPRPPAPAGPRPFPPPRMAPPAAPQTASRPPPQTAPLPPPTAAQPAPPREAPPVEPPSSPVVKTEPGIKRRVAGAGGSERPVKRPRFGNASSSPAPPSSPAAVASSPTNRIASSSSAAAHKPLSRVAAPSAAPAKAVSLTQAKSVTAGAKPAAPASTASSKPTPTATRAGPSSQPAQARAAPSSLGQAVSPRAGPSSSSQPAPRARATPAAAQVQSPPPLHPEHRRQAVWDVDQSDVEDLFVLWLRQGALRDISSHLLRGVALQRAADALRRIGWASADGTSFVVSATSREYRHARFGKLTIAKALGFIDF